jgi:hypothetical protein
MLTAGGQRGANGLEPATPRQYAGGAAAAGTAQSSYSAGSDAAAEQRVLALLLAGTAAGNQTGPPVEATASDAAAAASGQPAAASTKFDAAAFVSDALDHVALPRLRALLDRQLSDVRAQASSCARHSCTATGAARPPASPPRMARHSSLAPPPPPHTHTHTSPVLKQSAPHRCRPQLVSAINADYATFANLSRRLDGFESSLRRLATPLQAAQSALDGVRDGVASQGKAAAAASAAYAAADAREAALTDLLDGQEAAERAAALLAEAATTAAQAPGSLGVSGPLAPAPQPSSSNGPASGAAGGRAADTAAAATALLAHAETLHRAASLLFRAHRAADASAAAEDRDRATMGGGGSQQQQRLGPLADDLANRVAEEEATAVPLLVETLRAALSALTLAGPAPEADTGACAIAADTTETLHLSFHALSLLGRPALVVEAVAAALTRPLYAASFTQGRLDDGVRGSFRGASRVLDEVLGYVAAPRGAVATVLEAAVSTLARGGGGGGGHLGAGTENVWPQSHTPPPPPTHAA